MEKSLQLPTFSVSGFIAIVNQTLEYAYPIVEIEGEVSSFKVNHNKFVFFDIKDETGVLNCFMTVWQLRVPIEDGMKVVVSTSPKITDWGKFSLTVRAIRPKGEGAIKKSFELLKLKLEKEGLFADSRKRSLPSMPGHIAVVSSTEAAGYADFIKILNDRWGGVQVDVAHVQVQGASAADQIIGAINYFNQQEVLPEALVIIRGGGSADDLAVFNDELLVRAIAGSRIPTLTGIGHEIDESLADLAADVRAATPSNAAQLLVPDKKEVIININSKVSSILPNVLMTIKKLEQDNRMKIDRAGELLMRMVDDNIQYLNMQRGILASLNPMSVLARGYAILRGEAKVGANIEVETDKDIIRAEVKNVKRK